MPFYQSWVTVPPTPSGPETAHRSLTHDVKFLNNATAIKPGKPISLNGWFGSTRRHVRANEKGVFHMQGGFSSIEEIALPSGWNSTLAAGVVGYIDPSNGEWATVDPGGGQAVRTVPHPACDLPYDDAAAAASATSTHVHVALVSKGDTV